MSNPFAALGGSSSSDEDEEQAKQPAAQVVLKTWQDGLDVAPGAGGHNMDYSPTRWP